MGCKGICIRYQTKNQGGNEGYRKRKMCSTCGVYMPIVFDSCPCCHVRLKTRSHKSKGKGGSKNET